MFQVLKGGEDANGGGFRQAKSLQTEGGHGVEDAVLTRFGVVGADGPRNFGSSQNVIAEVLIQCM
jgi:hypothetical protein